MVRYCHLVVTIWGHCVISWFWSLECFYFLFFFIYHGAIWTMLVAHGILTMWVNYDVVG